MPFWVAWGHDGTLEISGTCPRHVGHVQEISKAFQAHLREMSRNVLALPAPHSGPQLRQLTTGRFDDPQSRPSPVRFRSSPMRPVGRFARLVGLPQLLLLRTPG